MGIRVITCIKTSREGLDICKPPGEGYFNVDSAEYPKASKCRMHGDTFNMFRYLQERFNIYCLQGRLVRTDLLYYLQALQGRINGDACIGPVIFKLNI